MMTKSKAKSDTLIEPKRLYPVLPLRDVVCFPKMILPLLIKRPFSVRSVDLAMENDQFIFLIVQKDGQKEAIKEDDLYKVGVLARVLQVFKLPDGGLKVLVEGLERAAIGKMTFGKEVFLSTLSPMTSKNLENEKVAALSRSLISQFESYVRMVRYVPAEMLSALSQITDADRLCDLVSAQLVSNVTERQKILEEMDIVKRLQFIFHVMETEMGVLNVERQIRRQVKKRIDKNHREYFLQEQMRAIQKELGDADDKEELDILEKKIKALGLPKDVLDKALAELKKLKMMSPMAAEASVLRNYLDWIVDLPWSKKSELSNNLKKAEEILDADHYGLSKVKERILEYLAVQQKTGKLKGPILCLVGPPGVGKTSLGESIARATGRTFVRMSLGGVHDEAEVRGHRRTYIGALPGRILQGMKKAKTKNPLFLLDEIDKLGNDWKGDPTSALLEVLDPAQNKAFNDHYLEVDYDLSDVMFVTTANSMKISPPLLDRMEVIRLAGYTEDEKVEIAQRHLIPRLLKETGLMAKEWGINASALIKLIRVYTKEAGVRNLERELSSLMRKATREILSKKGVKKITVTEKNLETYLGVPKYTFGLAEKKDLVGVTTGLAWTEVGGEILSIEALVMPGKGNLKLTGQLGDVMKESAEAAKSFVRSKSLSFGINPKTFEEKDIHVHVPEGATPKDGPSAGVAMCTSLVSALTEIPVRKDIAMTGEVTLLGRVLPIGGLKEKLLAALRAGIKTVLIPKENMKDLAEVPENVKNGLSIIPVSHVEEVLMRALVRPLVPLKKEKQCVKEELKYAFEVKGKPPVFRDSQKKNRPV